jgi:putative phage-type endonuclease
MKIINIYQNTTEWITWRKSHVMATDASVIMDMNQFKTIDQIWKEKDPNFKPEPMNDRMKRGHDLEPIARALFIEKTGIEVSPACIEHDDLWWHGASLDGLDKTGKIIAEIKCPKLWTHLQAQNEEIAPYYYAQMQHQLFTSGADLCYYISYNPDIEETLKMFIVKIYPDKNFQQRMIEKETEFFEKYMLGFEEPTWKLAIKPT